MVQYKYNHFNGMYVSARIMVGMVGTNIILLIFLATVISYLGEEVMIQKSTFVLFFVDRSDYLYFN